MRNYIERFHKEEEEKQLVVVASNQRTIEQAIQIFQPTQRVKQIKNSIATSIAKDFRPYSVALCCTLHFNTLCKKLLHNVLKCKWHKVA